MRKWICALSAALAAVTMLSLAAPAAVKVVTKDEFSDPATESKWEVDNFEPEDFDISHGVVNLAVGDNGYRKNRPEEYSDKSYAMQGRKLKLGKVSSAANWTASIKLQLDDAWFAARDDKDIQKRKETVETQKILDNKKKVVFRVDLNGLSSERSPAISVVKGGDGNPTIKYYDPEVRLNWATAGFRPEHEEPKVGKKSGAVTGAEPKEWYTLIISCKNGVVTYSIDDHKLGTYTLPSKKSPTYASITMQNFERPDVSVWDDVKLYNGIYTYQAES